MKLVIEVDLDDETGQWHPHVLRRVLEHAVKTTMELPAHVQDIRTAFNMPGTGDFLIFQEGMNNAETRCESRVVMSKAKFDAKMYSFEQARETNSPMSRETIRIKGEATP